MYAHATTASVIILFCLFFQLLLDVVLRWHQREFLHDCVTISSAVKTFPENQTVYMTKYRIFM